ncbi:hypothetical protein DFH09DRAFT_406870 [Mycena vulgaris]|nr:hypothetical protein DFH09DRAFT_406870 [Mycena vulgaris]
MHLPGPPSVLTLILLATTTSAAVLDARASTNLNKRCKSKSFFPVMPPLESEIRCGTDCGFEYSCPCTYSPATGCLPKFDTCEQLLYWPPQCEKCGECVQHCLDPIKCVNP